MAITNYERVGKALELLLAGLASFTGEVYAMRGEHAAL
jgi:hypothetical protein